MPVKNQLSRHQKPAQTIPRQRLLNLLRTQQLRTHLQSQAAMQLNPLLKSVLLKRWLQSRKWLQSRRWLQSQRSLPRRHQTTPARTQSRLQMIPQKKPTLLTKPLLEPSQHAAGAKVQRLQQQSALEVKTQLRCRRTVKVKFFPG